MFRGWEVLLCLRTSVTVLYQDIGDNRVFSPLRVILDSHLRTPTSARALRGGCLILTISQEAERARALQAAGARVVPLPSREGRVDLEVALAFLAREGVLTLMVEGGPRVLTALMEGHLADSLSLCREIGRASCRERV